MFMQIFHFEFPSYSFATTLVLAAPPSILFNIMYTFTTYRIPEIYLIFMQMSASIAIYLFATVPPALFQSGASRLLRHQ